MRETRKSFPEKKPSRNTRHPRGKIIRPEAIWPFLLVARPAGVHGVTSKVRTRVMFTIAARAKHMLEI